MTRLDYNLSGILGAKASIHNKRATSPLAASISGRSPAFHIADCIHTKWMKSRRDVSAQSPIVWRLEPAHIAHRQEIISKLGAIGRLQAIASGMDMIHVVGVYAEVSAS